MAEEINIHQRVWVVAIITIVIMFLFVIAQVTALKIGPTPTPTPTPPTPTPRIVYKTIIITPTPTPTPEPTVLPGEGLSEVNKIYVYQNKEGAPGFTFIARQDSAAITREYPEPAKPGTNKEAHFWLFGIDGTYDQILDHDVVVDSWGSYHVYLSLMETSGLKQGKYNAVVQFAGDNGKMDVVYSPAHNRFESIYSSVTPVSIAGDLPSAIYQKLIWMVQDRAWSDDQYEEFTVVVEDPWVSIDDVYIDGEKVYLKGATNLATSNQLQIILDEDKIVTEQDREMSTRDVVIQAYKDYNYPRNIWEMNFTTIGMFPGKHYVTLTAPKFNSETTSSFEIVETWPVPTPTITMKRYVTGFPEVTQTGPGDVGMEPPTPIPTPTTIKTTPPTPTPTPEETIATPTPAPTKTKALLLNAKGDSPIGNSLKAMPLSPFIGILAVVIVIGLVLIRPRSRP